MPKTKTKTTPKASAKAHESKPTAKTTGKSKAERTAPAPKGAASEKALAAAPDAPRAKTPATKKKASSDSNVQTPRAPEPTTSPAVTSTVSTPPPPPVEVPGSVERAASPPATTEAAAATQPSSAPVASTEPAAAAPKPSGESRLPPPGTVLQRRDRRGLVLSECVVVEDGGVRYAGTVYASLSAAALAAVRDRGRTATSINGWSYWGLATSARAGGGRRDPLTLLDAAWVRFRERVNGLLGDDVDEEARGRVLAQLKEHAKALERLGSTAA